MTDLYERQPTRRRRVGVTLALLVAMTAPISAEIAPRGQRTTNDIRYGNWRKVCAKAAGAETLCRTSITGTYETGQIAVRIDLVEREDHPIRRLQIFVPVGMYLQIPAKISIDGGRPHRLAYTWCLSNNCVAADAASSRFIKEMETGKTLTLEVVDSNLLSLTTSLPLAQFAGIHRGAPEQRVEQDIEE